MTVEEGDPSCRSLNVTVVDDELVQKGWDLHVRMLLEHVVQRLGQNLLPIIKSVEDLHGDEDGSCTLKDSNVLSLCRSNELLLEVARDVGCQNVEECARNTSLESDDGSVFGREPHLNAFGHLLQNEL